jgi:hypothetical protein
MLQEEKRPNGWESIDLWEPPTIPEATTGAAWIPPTVDPTADMEDLMRPVDMAIISQLTPQEAQVPPTADDAPTFTLDPDETLAEPVGSADLPPLEYEEPPELSSPTEMPGASIASPTSVHQTDVIMP